jgi:heme/copper-type cytochrome/quinol oxidase subunit 3
VFVLILLTALVTIVAGYFYLGGNVAPELLGSPAEPIERPALATGLLAAGLIPVVAAVRAIGRRRFGLLRLGVTATLVLAAAHLWLLLSTWLDSGLSPSTDGRHSAFVGVAGFHAIASIILLVMLAVAAIWAWSRPADARGHATAWNAALVYGFAVASAVIVFSTLYLVPRFG